jgi:hypothetical protein
MTEPRPDSIQFCHKQTLFGVVLMVRDTKPANGYGDFEWGNWRKANYVEYEIYMRRKTS